MSNYSAMPFLTAQNPTVSANTINAELDGGFQLSVNVLEEWLIRVAVVPKAGLHVDRTWMIAPQDTFSVYGRPRLCADDFSGTGTTYGADQLTTDLLQVSLQTDPLLLSFRQRAGDQWIECLRDRQGGAYQWLAERKEFQHFQARDPLCRHYGLGDKTGLMDRTRRRFRCMQTDALGYDAELSDPLYKHAPFYIADHPEHGAVGVLYETCCEIDFDFGSEHSNYYEPFRHVSSREKGLVYYVIAGPKIKDIVPRLMQLTGMQAMPPRWAMGFAFSAMAHTDAADAPNVINQFVDNCSDHHVPLSAIHLGSGYSLHGKHRHVFQWNCEKFPDPALFIAGLKDRGLRTCANIKPVLLTSHPEFEVAREQGWFIRRADGTPALERFWDGIGSQLDFTNPWTYEWWTEQVTKSLFDHGIDGVWNDNNEAELWDETATLEVGSSEVQAMSARPVHALLMTAASYAAAVASRPNERPHMISRAGPIGIAQFGETWTGDNETSWHTLKWNLRQGLSMSLSGFPITGHDIGGFSGPSPGPELLVRWFQMMALHPRAVMNSWKPELADGANLPYMHEEVIPLVREALNLRYTFLPQIYSLAWHCHRNGQPIIAPTFYHFDDEECHQDSDTFMLGDNVLVAPVVDEGAEQIDVFLPACEHGWFEFHGDQHFDGGQSICVDVPLGKLPIFIRAGSALLLADAFSQTSPHDAQSLSLQIYPGNEPGSWAGDFFYDDGISVLTPGDEKICGARLLWDRDSVKLDIAGALERPVDVRIHNQKLRNFKKHHQTGQREN